MPIETTEDLIWQKLADHAQYLQKIAPFLDHIISKRDRAAADMVFGNFKRIVDEAFAAVQALPK